jgi:choline monooxygenase
VACVVDFDWYVTKDKAKDERYIEDSLKASEKVQEEDIWLCERVQRGLDSPCFGQGGRYAPSMEGGEYMYHRRLYEDVLGAAGLVTQPPNTSDP